MKNIYITWHYTTHGVAFLKHILSHFYSLKKLNEPYHFDGLDQKILNLTFDNSDKLGYKFDEVIYLTAPQTAFDELSSRRFSHRNNALEDSAIKSSPILNAYTEMIQKFDTHKFKDELLFFKENHPDLEQEYLKLFWRNVQHYPLEDQIDWLQNWSNFKNHYKGRLKVENLPIHSLRNESEIAKQLQNWFRQNWNKLANSNLIINVSLGSNETQVVWHILAEAGQLPPNTRFIKTYDDKRDNPKDRFKKFSILEIPTNLISTIGSGFTIYSDSKSPSRILVNKKMESYLNTGFSILLLGERGIGKSQIAEEAKNSTVLNGKFIQANCASFDEDSKAEAELFGYEGDAFTGALKKGKKGLLEEADNGILFLDEIHHLSKAVQAKLMKALQTDKYNRMAIRKMGSSKEVMVECRLIFATNKPISELRTLLLPDFYDRIVQHVINIPPLRDIIEDRISDWERVWKGLRFKDPVPKEPDLIHWLKKQTLSGNFRDLQKIAIYYKSYLDFDESIKALIFEKTPFDFARNEFKSFHSKTTTEKNGQFNFSIEKTTKEFIADFQFELQKWAVEHFGGREPAIEHFRKLGDSITVRTFNDWKNKKSMKNKEPGI